jgi:RNA polymerase primary sigma factor
MKGIKIVQSITLKDTDSADQFLKELSKYEPLSRERETDYFLRYKDGDKAAGELLINHNLRFVVSVAKKYQFSYPNLTLMDIISLGCLGLLKALDKYDLNRGVKFISYAVWWIRHSITDKAASENDTIECPQSVYLNHKKVIKFVKEYTANNLCEPTIVEIEEFVKSESLNINSIADVFNTSIVNLHNTVSVPHNDNSDNLWLIDVIEDKSLPAPDDAFQDDGQKRLVSAMLSILNKRERTIVKMYHGLDGYPEMGLQEIGDTLGVTPERARQIKRKALVKMMDAYKENRIFPSIPTITVKK